MERKRSTTSLINKTQLCCSFSFFFMLSICTMIFNSTTVSAITCLETRCAMFSKADINFQELKEETGQGIGKTDVHMGLPRRILGGPGSSPPRCTAKCGKCTPCRPVHVPVPPGTLVTAEYYPEAWRCKCGNKLYMP